MRFGYKFSATADPTNILTVEEEQGSREESEDDHKLSPVGLMRRTRTLSLSLLRVKAFTKQVSEDVWGDIATSLQGGHAMCGVNCRTSSSAEPLRAPSGSPDDFTNATQT